MGEGVINRGKWVLDLRILMDEHSITEREVLALIAYAHNMSWELNAQEINRLIKKNLVYGGFTELKSEAVNTTKLFKIFTENSTLEEEDTAALILNTPPPHMTPETIALADSIFDRFVSDLLFPKEKIEIIAKKYFFGEYYAAKWYVAFQSLFPKGTLEEDYLWNKHFGITYKGMNKWEERKSNYTRFFRLYRSLDMGLFLSGTFYFIEDGIDRKKNTAYISKVSKYFPIYTQWYSKAKKMLAQAKKIEEESSVIEKPDNGQFL